MYKKLKLVESASDRYQVREYDGPGAKFGVYDTKEKKFVQKGPKYIMVAACDDLNNKKKLTEEEHKYIIAMSKSPIKDVVNDESKLDAYITDIFTGDQLEDPTKEIGYSFSPVKNNAKVFDSKYDANVIADKIKNNYPDWKAVITILAESTKLTEDLDDEEIEDKAAENEENQEELEDTLDSEEDQEENPVEEESELDKELNELRDILVDLDLNLYQITDKEDLNNSIYIIGKVADESNDVLMLVDTKPEEVNSEEIPDEEPIINNVDIDDNINEAEDNSNDLEKAKKIIENCGFTIQDENVAYTRNETGWEIQQYTPEGEDWFVDIIVNNDVNKLIDEISSYAENFDIDEEVELYVDMRGQRGVPSSISALVEDAEWKKDQLTNLANELQKLKSGNINESAEVVSILRNPENSNERVEINKLPNGKYQTLYYSDEKSFSGAQSQFDDLDSAIKQVQKLRPSYKLDEIDNNTYNDEDEAAYYRYKELYANSNLARHKEAMEKAAKACKEKGIKLREAEEIDLENNEESEEDEHKTELEQRFDFVKLPNSFEEVNKLNPRYGEELTPDHEAVVEYLMNCLIEMNPEAAEELQKEEEPEETPIEEPDYDVDLGIDIEGEEDLDSEDQY